jgi:hypothetical protein
MIGLPLELIRLAAERGYGDEFIQAGEHGLVGVLRAGLHGQDAAALANPDLAGVVERLHDLIFRDGDLSFNPSTSSSFSSPAYPEDGTARAWLLRR